MYNTLYSVQCTVECRVYSLLDCVFSSSAALYRQSRGERPVLTDSLVSFAVRRGVRGPHCTAEPRTTTSLLRIEASEFLQFSFDLFCKQSGSYFISRVLGFHGQERSNSSTGWWIYCQMPNIKIMFKTMSEQTPIRL